MRICTPLFILLLGVGATTGLPAFAQDAHHGTHGSQTAQDASGAMTDGEVKKVDKSAGKLTIKHGPLENLGMGAMTMVFRVQDPVMLEQVKPGDRIRFVAEQLNGALTVTRFEANR